MFEKIVLRRSESGQGLSGGDIAEALLFYRNVHVLLDPQSLGSVIQTLGAEELLALLERGRITAAYAEDMLAANNHGRGSLQTHSFNTMFISSKRDGKTMLKSRRERLQHMLELSQLSRGDSRRYAERLLKRVSVTRYSADTFAAGGVHKSALTDLTDAAYVTAAFKRMLQQQIGFEAYAEKLRVEVIDLPANQFALSHNIDFVSGNARRKQIDPTLENLTEGNLLVALLDASADLNIASHYGGDFYTSTTNSDIIRIRYAEALKRTDMSLFQLQQFRELLLPAFPRIREVINSGERTFREFEKLLDDAGSFRNIVHQAALDADLVSEYLAAITRHRWLSSIGGKPVRFVVGLAVEFPNPVAGQNWTTADDLLLGNLNGWRPSHFVDDKLKPFLKPASREIS